MLPKDWYAKGCQEHKQAETIVLERKEAATTFLSPPYPTGLVGPEVIPIVLTAEAVNAELTDVISRSSC